MKPNDKCLGLTATHLRSVLRYDPETGLFFRRKSGGGQKRNAVAGARANRWCNLRSASRSQNCGNARAQSNNTSGFKGVVLDKKSGSWRAMIRVNHKLLHVGSFAGKEDAAKAYNEAALFHFGEFAKLNEVAA